MIAVVARFALAERVRPRTWLGFVLCVAGVVWLSAGGTADETSPNPALGNFLEVLAMACATGYMITLKRLSVRYTPWFLTAVQAVVGMVFYLPILLMPFTRMPEALPTGPVLAVVYLGSIVTIGAYGCYNYGLSRIPASQASAFVNLIPVSAAVMGFLFLGERFTLSQMAASAVVLAGLFLTQSGRRRKNAAVPAGPPPSGPDVDNP
jgi:drug/metabolite transporter (DMT)-like permease